MSYATLDALRAQLGGTPSAHSPEYLARMMHPLPAASVVDRVAFILDVVRGKRVLEFGASGPLHQAIVHVASECLGVDRAASAGVVGFDLDAIAPAAAADLGSCPWRVGPPLLFFQEGKGAFTPEIIVCGEVIEHLSNPGWFFTRLKHQYPGIAVIVTVPNAFNAIGPRHLARGFENVNIDHVAWYSHRTLRTLVERAGYAVTHTAYYNGSGPTAEGLIAVVE